MVRKTRWASRIPVALLCCVASASASLSVAQSWPAKPITLVVPLGAGGPTDIMARFTGQKLADRLGASVVVENRPGAGGAVGAESVSRATPDGHTVLFITQAITIFPSVLTKLSFSPETDLLAVTPVATGPLVLVVNAANEARTSSIQTLADLVAQAKAKSGTVTYGSGGNGTNPHLASAWMALLSRLDIVHVPYKSNGPALNDLLAGRITFLFDALLTTQPHIRSGKLRALAITDRRRWQAIPEVPTMMESGYADFEVNVWFGMFVPRGTPSAVVERLNAEMEKIAAAPDTQARFRELAHEPMHMPQARFAELVKSETRRWATLVKAAGVRVE